MGQALEGVGELLVVRPLAAAVAAPTAERRLFVVLIVIIVVITVVIAVTPVLPLPFLLELVPVPVHQDSLYGQKNSSVPEHAERTGTGRASHVPSEGGKSIRAQAGSVRSGIACQMDSEFTKYRSSCTDGQVHLVFFFQERDFRRSNDQKARIILLPSAKPFSFSFAGGGGVCYKKGCGHSNLKRIKAASYENRPIRFFMYSTPLFF